MAANEERSVQDNVINSYEVFCKDREIIFKTEYPYEPKELTNVKFTGVVAYHFQDDSEFGSIIFDFECCHPLEIFDEHRAMIEARLRYGWPGTWAAERSQAEAYFADHGIQGWHLCASVGLEGWILATSMEIIAVE